MICYFSATGNCRHVAKTLAAALGEEAVSILDIRDEISLSKGEYFGLVTPTYFWELPKPVREFLEKIEINQTEDHYSFVIATFGTTPGCTGEEARRLLAAKGLLLDAAYSIRMPDNWTVWFDLSDSAKVAKQNEKADRTIEKVLERIGKQEQGNHMFLRTPYFTKYFTDAAFSKARMTKNLHLEESCIGCGICAKNCPVSAIEIKDGKAVWVKEQCALCFGCLHHCPKFAIQYGNNATKRHGQYVHE
ncbi:MAG: EFR1 family ferrodoxin [Lachnospiraceae bacterium]|nr:EFR1 family ferrodoxin [Lachnospiraceae bacterium]